MGIYVLSFLLLIYCGDAWAANPNDFFRQQAINDALNAGEENFHSSTGKFFINENSSQVTDSSNQSEKNKFSSFRKHSWDLAFQMEGFQYETGDKWPYYYANSYPVSDKVKKAGMLYGLFGSKTWTFYAPIHSWDEFFHKFELPNFVKLEVEILDGSTDYSSYVTGTLNGLSAWRLESRFLAGYDIQWDQSMVLSPYLGLGYSRFTDYTGGYVDYFVNNYAKYENIYNYLYAPIGVEMFKTINEKWDIKFKLEADIIIYGNVEYHLNDIPGPLTGYYDVNTGEPLVINPLKSDSDFKGGFGFRTSLKLIRKYKKYDFYFEPYFNLLYLNSTDPTTAQMYAINNNKNYESVYPDKSLYKPLWDASSYKYVLGAKAGIQF